MTHSSQDAGSTAGGTAAGPPPPATHPRPSAADPRPEVGVGPWPGGPSAWPDEPRYDAELLREGDRRNVLDRYRYWSVEAIVADIDTRRHPLHVAVENFGHDMNIGSVVRTANAFAVAEVHIVGRRRWNRRGAMVTDRYQHLRHHDDVAGLLGFAADRGLAVVGIDNVPGSVPIEGRPLPRAALMIFGQESAGLSEQARAGCDEILHITQYGSTRSINAGAAAAVAMHCWVAQHAEAPGG